MSLVRCNTPALCNLQEAMGKSPLHSKHEEIDYGGSPFDPQMDFSQVCNLLLRTIHVLYRIISAAALFFWFDQFLKEARQHGREVNLKATTSGAEEVKKSKKSWKTSLFFWWKAEKKIKTSMEPANSSHHSSKLTGHRHVSGPVFESERAVHLQRQTSGPLTNLFNNNRGTENQIPYMSLHHLNNHSPVKVYGPVYLVT